MNEKESFEQNLRRAFAPHEPNPELKSKVKQKSLRLQARSSRRPLWLACGAAGFAGAGFLAVFLVMPATSLAQAVIKQASAFDGHLVTYDVLPDGKWQRTGEQWTNGKKLRLIERGAHPMEFLSDSDRGFAISLNEGMGAVKVQDLTIRGQVAPSMPEVLTQQNLKAFLADRGIHQVPRIERTQFNGQAADCVGLRMGPYTEDKLYADPETHRMLGWSYRVKKVWPNNPPENNYVHVFVVDPKPLPPHIFDPVFNIDGVPTDVLADRAKWQDRLSKPLRVFSFNLLTRPDIRSMKTKSQMRLAAVRSVMVNSVGDVFVLFSGIHEDFGTSLAPATIHDATGGRYVRGGSFLPSEWGGRRLERFVFNGAPLEGAWFIRLGGGALKGPISVGFKQEFGRRDDLTFSYTAEPERINRDFPGYMPYMYLPIGTHTKWLEMRTDELATARDQAKDYAGEEKLIREMIDLNEGKEGQEFYLPADLDCRLAAVFEKRGKKPEARAMYGKAQKDLAAQKFDPGPWLKNQIDAGLARLNGQR